MSRGTGGNRDVSSQPRSAETERIQKTSEGYLIDGSRGIDNPVPGLQAYVPKINPMSVIEVKEHTEVKLSWSATPLIADPGDLILVNDSGERHPIKRDLFEQTYSEIAGSDGLVTKTAPTMAKQMPEPFTVQTLEGQATGQAGDWLAQGADGECWPIPNETFHKRYQVS